MSMHLHHPSLSLTGKRKGKTKFRNAEEARKARELEESWKDIQKKWGVEAEDKKRKRALAAEVWLPEPASLKKVEPKIPSLNGGRDMSPAFKIPPKVYTGSDVIGIAVLHKSCLQPIFSKEAAEDVAKMRR